MRVFFFLLGCFLLPGLLWAKPVEIVLWHALAGYLGSEVQNLANQFNASQKEFMVKPVYKGDYVETLTSYAAAFRAHQPPDLVQVFEVGKASMLAPKGIIKPVEALMREQQIRLPIEDFIPVVRQYYSKNGQLMAMPLNLSVPVIFYNADRLLKLGYTDKNFPKTWQEMEVLAARLKQSGAQCAYTTGHPAWILIESYLALHGFAAIQTNPLRAAYSYPQFVAHLARLKRWQNLGYFRYGGRSDDATILFTSGICPLYSQSSGGYNSLQSMVNFRLGIAPLPLDEEASAIRYANVAGGAAIWVTSGRSAEKEKGIALFFAFLARPEIQQKWHEHTGYLPIGFTGPYASIVASSKHPALALALVDLANKSGIKSRLMNKIPQNQIRGSNDSSLEALFAGLKTPEKAIQDAMVRANHFILRFERNTTIQ